MKNFEQQKLLAEQKKLLAERGMYLPQFEKAACGVGLVANIAGEPCRDVVQMGIDALKAVWHRGAVDADGKTGDGAGIHIAIPQQFFADWLQAVNEGKDYKGQIAVGQIFLPRNDLAEQEKCRVICEHEVIRNGYQVLGWRHVPVDASIIGAKAESTRPEIEQLVIGNSKNASAEHFERDLFLIRRFIEKRVIAGALKEFYICSLSSRSLIYKGLFLAEQLDSFYPDLQDERFISHFAIYHQRYSTNTFPQWWLAQPFRILAHNGEINTLSGNRNLMRSYERRMQSDTLGDSIQDLIPVITASASDSAALDNCFEIMLQTDAERSLPEVKSMLMPEAWELNRDHLPKKLVDFYRWVSRVVEPWDGPAAICGYFGDWLLGGLDRSGFRPLRYSVTKDGFLVMGSETGMVAIDPAQIERNGIIGAGEMLALNFKQGKLYGDDDLKMIIAKRQDYGKRVSNIKRMKDMKIQPLQKASLAKQDLLRHQMQVGWTIEDIEMTLFPIAEEGKEPTGSMGDDSPLAVLTDHYRPLHHYFRQDFSQVTNPPLDSLRERYVMSLRTHLGNQGNILGDDKNHDDVIVQLESPIILSGRSVALKKILPKTATAMIDCTFQADSLYGLRDALHRIRTEAEQYARSGKIHLFLTDRQVSEDKAIIPMILATSAIHSHLLDLGLRSYCSLNVETAECYDVHNVAVLIGVGATTIFPWLTEQTLLSLHGAGRFGDIEAGKLLDNYRMGIDAGLLKIISKMGISIIGAYRGGYNFEAVGLSRSLVAEFFPGLPSRISGVGLSGLQKKVINQHQKAFAGGDNLLPIGGFLKARSSGDVHGWDGKMMHVMQEAVGRNSYELWQKYSKGIHSMKPIFLRDLLDFRYEKVNAIPLEHVSSVTEIRKKFIAPGISLGALSPEAHETLAIAMNRIGARSDSGEGGEDKARFTPRSNGDNASSAIKQVASGRFGVTAEYLNNCREIEIKMAQGAKPGEGGQLPGHKVSPLIARLRHSTEGVTLISPPPHHDIYSIEDLAQLIYDLKQINPDAEVCVKLVARSGIGTVAAGVAKAHADTILISGHSGGTGASPQSSIKYAGLPWEMGLSEVHQVLMLNNLRHKVKLRTDGGIKTGRDVVMAAILGAEEYGIGTAALVAMGCIMVRQCHSNTCPVGVCTQDESLREKFTGTPEKVINLMTFIAEEVRDILSSLGVSSLEEVIGRTDLLWQVSRGNVDLDDLDLNALLFKMEQKNQICKRETRNPVPDGVDIQMIKDAKPFFDHNEKIELSYNIRNTDRTVGARLSSAITRKYGMDKLPDNQLYLKLKGWAGQSFGAFAVKGLTLHLTGDANDYVGKGLSGGIIIIHPYRRASIASNQNSIMGNTVLYGATAGKLYAAGTAGQRFAVRNSGANAVVEGIGNNGCEYMTGGEVLVLGAIGRNFGAGMTGGHAFLYGKDLADSEHLINQESVHFVPATDDFWQAHIKQKIETHHRLTGSKHAENILLDWEIQRDYFFHVIPHEMVSRLAHPISALSSLSAVAAE
ncbi:MAG: glutamate synthase large subunit [Alphaproteobacteria bacterium]|nr:glutamate synthase large subunit [Alphaproteobacteria bacterium]